MATTHKYVDLAGLTEFKNKLVAAYAANTADTFTVNYAKNAGRAEGDENGANIASTYLTKTDATATYVPKAGYIAYTQAEKDKLAGIEAEAQVNVLEAVAVKDESIVTMSGKTAIIDLDGYAKKSDIASVLDFKGVKATVADLPTTAKKGDVWIVTTGEHGANEEYVCTTSAGDTGHPKWEALGAVIDLSGYATTSDLTDAIALEVTNRNAAIKVVADDLAGEITRAEGAEGALAGRLDIIEGADTVNGSIKKAVKDEATARDAAIAAAIDALDVTDTVAGDYVTSVSENNGKIALVKGSKGAIAATDTGLVDGATVYAYVEGKEYADHTYEFTSAADGKEGEFTYVEKLNGTKVGQTHTITVNADLNVLEGVKVNGSALTISNKAVDIDMSAYTDQTLVTGSAEPCSSAAVLAAGFAYESEFSRVTEAEIDGLFGTTTV